MYVRFDAPTKPVSGRMGLLVAHASIGPVNPALPDVEITSFGVWTGADGSLKITLPSNGNNFPHLSGRLVAKTITEEDKAPTVETSPCLAGKQQLDALRASIGKVWTDNPAKRLAAGLRFDIDMAVIVASQPAKPAATGTTK